MERSHFYPGGIDTSGTEYWEPGPSKVYRNQDESPTQHEGNQGFWNPGQKHRSGLNAETHLRMYDEQQRQQQVQQQQHDIYDQYHQVQNHQGLRQSPVQQDIREQKAPNRNKTSHYWSARIGELLTHGHYGRSVTLKTRAPNSTSMLDKFHLSRSPSAPQPQCYDSIPPSLTMALTQQSSVQSMNDDTAGTSCARCVHQPHTIFTQRSFPGSMSASHRPLRVPGSCMDGSGLALSAEAISRVLVPSTKIGAVIGKGGAIVKYIRECAAARITISDAGDDAAWSGSGERLVHIIGSFCSVCSAFGAILAHAETPSNGEPLPGLASLIGSGVLSGESAVALDASISMPPSFFRLLVPKIKAGALIGRQGATINLIRELSGAHIEISNHTSGSPAPANVPLINGLSQPPGSSPDRIVTVAGAFSSCVRAHYLIMASLLDPSAIYLPHFSQVPFSYPTENVSSNCVPQLKTGLSPPGFYDSGPASAHHRLSRCSFDDFQDSNTSEHRIKRNLTAPLQSHRLGNDMFNASSSQSLDMDDSNWPRPLFHSDSVNDKRPSSKDTETQSRLKDNLQSSYIDGIVNLEVPVDYHPRPKSRDFSNMMGMFRTIIDNEQFFSEPSKVGAAEKDAYISPYSNPLPFETEKEKHSALSQDDYPLSDNFGFISISDSA